MSKLSKKAEAKWIKALKSGKYKQGLKYYLDGAERHCCLGVACEIDIAREANSFECRQRDFLTLNIQHKLASFNDGGKSFNWIAGYIKRYL